VAPGEAHAILNGVAQDTSPEAQEDLVLLYFGVAED
jgi:hypothetical protein